MPVGGDVGTPVGGTLGAGDGSAVGTAVGTGVGQGVCTKRQQASTPLAGSTPPSQGPSNLWLAPSALVMASGPSLPEPVTAVTEPVVVISPSSHAMAGHSAVGDGVGTRDGGSVGRDVGALVGTPDGASVGWDVGSAVGTLVGVLVGSWDCHVGSAVGTLVGSGDGGVVGTALGTKEK